MLVGIICLANIASHFGISTLHYGAASSPRFGPTDLPTFGGTYFYGPSMTMNKNNTTGQGYYSDRLPDHNS